MGESANNICIIPGCEKEVYAPKMLFCGEHERGYNDIKDQAVDVGVNVVKTVIPFAHIFDKKDK